MTLIVASETYANWPEVRDLIRSSFAYMEEVLGHTPKSALVDTATLSEAARTGTVFLEVQGNTPRACLFCRPSCDVPNALYLGRLAVAPEIRGKGIARKLVDAAAELAVDEGFTYLTLDTAKALTHLHTAFGKLGFELTKPLSDTDGDVVTMVRPLHD